MSKELKKLSDVDLNKTIEEKRKTLLNSRFDMSGTAKRNDKKTTNLKREIAQMLTEKRIRETSKVTTENK
jgi:ribosomal protein L29